jgi:single-stranded-DNA-specific exonuclease
VGYGSSNLYHVIHTQSHLIKRSIGPASVIQLSLPSENLDIFTQAIQHQFRLYSTRSVTSNPSDLWTVTIGELQRPLYDSIRAIEPFGFGNPIPRLQLRNVRFDQVFTQKLKDQRHQSVIYRAIEFKLLEHNSTDYIFGKGWGYTQDELPKGWCNAIVQLENNVRNKRYEVRLLKWFEAAELDSTPILKSPPIIDLRNGSEGQIAPDSIQLTTCPTDWNTLQIAYRRSCIIQKPLVLNYKLPNASSIVTLIGMAKYLARTENRVSSQKWCDRLSISAFTLQIGIEILRDLGFKITTKEDGLQVSRARIPPPSQDLLTAASERWQRSIREEGFRQQYFMQVSLPVIHAFLAQSGN